MYFKYIVKLKMLTNLHSYFTNDEVTHFVLIIIRYFIIRIRHLIIFDIQSKEHVGTAILTESIHFKNQSYIRYQFIKLYLNLVGRYT